jgi:hypothetical protein
MISPEEQARQTER